MDCKENGVVDPSMCGANDVNEELSSGGLSVCDLEKSQVEEKKCFVESVAVSGSMLEKQEQERILMDLEIEEKEKAYLLAEAEFTAAKELLYTVLEVAEKNRKSLNMAIEDEKLAYEALKAAELAYEALKEEDDSSSGEEN